MLDKRRERRDDPRDMREYKSESRRELRIEETRDRRELRIESRESRTVSEDGRERRELRVEERRHMIIDEQYSEPELMERGERDKRHKRNHKHDRARDRDKVERDREHREKQLRDSMEIIQDNEAEMDLGDPTPSKDPKEMTEQELRRERYHQFHNDAAYYQNVVNKMFSSDNSVKIQTNIILDLWFAAWLQVTGG